MKKNSIFLLLLIIVSLFNLIFFILTLISALITYIFAKFRSPIDASPVLFLMIIFAVKLNFFYLIIFYILASLIPVFLAGGEISLGTFMFMCVFFLLAIIAKFAHLPIVELGIILSIANLLIGFLINKLKGHSIGSIFSIGHTLITIFYFLSLGEYIFSIV